MKRRNNVLIVEDDVFCQELLRRAVLSVDEGAGIDWQKNAENAALAVLQARNRGCPYDLVVTDIYLDGDLSGLDLWRICKEIGPFPPFVITSGLSIPTFFGTMSGEEEMPIYLPKPLYLEECRYAVRRFMAFA